MDARISGRLLIVSAAVMWSTSGFFVKAPLFNDWPLAIDSFPVRGPLLAFWRAVFASLVLLPFVSRPRWTFKLVPMLVCYALMNYAFLSALTLTNEANAIWLQHTAPVWIFAVGVLAFGEAVHARDAWLLGFCLAGVGLILCFEARGQSWGGVALGLASSLAYAGVVLSLRQLRNEDGAWLVLLNNLVTAVVFFPFVLYYGVWPSGVQTLSLAFFGMFQMGLPYLLFARGLRHTSGHEAAGIVLLEPILVPLWVFLAWGQAATYQPPQWWTFAGGGLILLGLLVRYTNLRRSPSTI